MRPDKLALMIINTTNMRSRDITDIQVMDNFSFVTVPFEYADPLIKAFKAKKKGQKPLIMHAKT
jgi:ATP-dependent RNA helicase DeaD